MKKIKFCFLIITVLASIFVLSLPTYAKPAGQEFDPLQPNSDNNSQNSKENTNSNNTSNNSESEAKPKDNTPVTTGKELFRGGACHYVLGMVNWDCDVVITDNQEDLKTQTWIIAANVASDITVLASFLALGYVIYGGYLYIFSGGEPSKAVAGKKTLTQAFIGLAITMTSTIIMSTIRSVLLGNSEQNLLNCATEGCVEPDLLFINTLHWFIAIAGIVSAIFIVYGGIAYTSSAGDPNKLSQAKKIITNALIGLAIVALAEITVAFVSRIIMDSKAVDEDNGTSSMNINNIIIAKNDNYIPTDSLLSTNQTKHFNDSVQGKEYHV